jgi:hypothetical protein
MNAVQQQHPLGKHALASDSPDAFYCPAAQSRVCAAGRHTGHQTAQRHTPSILTLLSSSRTSLAISSFVCGNKQQHQQQQQHDKLCVYEHLEQSKVMRAMAMAQSDWCWPCNAEVANTCHNACHLAPCLDVLGLVGCNRIAAAAAKVAERQSYNYCDRTAPHHKRTTKHACTCQAIAM